MYSDLEEESNENYTSRCIVGVGCIAITLVAAGITGFLLYIEEMFSKKIWM